MADPKKGHFPAPPILNIFFQKFHGFDGHFDFFFQKKYIFYFFPNENQLGSSYEVSFISALWMVSSESWRDFIQTNLHMTVSTE